MLIVPEARARKRLDVPHEPGQWVEIQRLAFMELPALKPSQSPADTMLDLMAGSDGRPPTVAAWSYDMPVTRESVSWLDPETARWLYHEIDEYVMSTGAEADQGNATAPSMTS